MTIYSNRFDCVRLQLYTLNHRLCFRKSIGQWCLNSAESRPWIKFIDCAYLETLVLATNGTNLIQSIDHFSPPKTEVDCNFMGFSAKNRQYHCISHCKWLHIMKSPPKKRKKEKKQIIFLSRSTSSSSSSVSSTTLIFQVFSSSFSSAHKLVPISDKCTHTVRI